ncbi:hypothetical protein FQN54_007749 [Arachnomyces sp. PD_36]|nr:hypothetical protein FQN54_007749 [Arachnomyces sp. PD_36]
MAKEIDEAPTEGIKAEDAIFMAECLKHLQTTANIDINGVAAALNYKNSASVANRIRVLKKKFDLKVGCTTAANPDGAGSATNSPRKGAAANRGPIKAAAATDDGDGAETKSGSGAGAKRTRTPRKKAAKSAAKVEVESDADDDENVKDED